MPSRVCVGEGAVPAARERKSNRQLDNEAGCDFGLSPATVVRRNTFWTKHAGSHRRTEFRIANRNLVIVSRSRTRIQRWSGRVQEGGGGGC